jgi:hypothetical protein
VVREGIEMKLDIILIRDLLEYFEKNLPEEGSIESKRITIQNIEPKEIGYHILLLGDRKFIDISQPSITDKHVWNCNIHRLTLDGHILLENLRINDKNNISKDSISDFLNILK